MMLTATWKLFPFFSKTIKIEDPSGYKVISESKPMPLVSSKGFCWATVYDAAIVNASALYHHC